MLKETLIKSPFSKLSQQPLKATFCTYKNFINSHKTQAKKSNWGKEAGALLFDDASNKAGNGTYKNFIGASKVLTKTSDVGGQKKFEKSSCGDTYNKTCGGTYKNFINSHKTQTKKSNWGKEAGALLFDDAGNKAGNSTYKNFIGASKRAIKAGVGGGQEGVGQLNCGAFKRARGKKSAGGLLSRALKARVIIFFLIISIISTTSKNGAMGGVWAQSGETLYTKVDVEKPDYVIGDKRIFLNALNAFDANDYGATLKWIDKAKAARMQKTQWEVQTLKLSMRSPDVKVFGDDIANVAKVLAEREEYDALEVINRYKKYYTLEAFDNSMKRLIAFIQSQSSYPEADYLSGRVYQLEGEYDIAQKLYLKAYENADILDIPDQKFDILYSLGEIAFIKKDYKKYEEYLVLIVSFDPSYKNKSFLASIKRAIRSKRDDNVEKFFKMYRASNYKLLNAYFALSEYYRDLGEGERSLSTASLGCLTGFTKIYEVVKRRSADFNYTTIGALLDEAALYPDIVEWGKENNVWKGFNDLAQYTLESGYEAFANKLYEVLQAHNPEEYWRREAKVMLCKIEEKNADKDIKTVTEPPAKVE